MIDMFIYGMAVGVCIGMFIYARFIDKPEVVNNYNDKIKNKAFGKGIIKNIFKKKQ